MLEYRTNAAMFDNRSSKIARGARPGTHFVFELNNKKIVYCYIRKNASSSFKRFIISQSPNKDQRKDFQTSLKFLSHFHAAKTQRFEKFDHSIFVVRDPVDRILSVYKNKFVQRNGNIDIFESYSRATGKNPEAATFSDFIINYLTRPFSDLDVHVRSQSGNLLPVVYSDAIPLKGLHNRMIEIIGPRLADRYFLPQVNSTSDASLIELDAAYLLPASDLRRNYLEQNEFPTTKCFLPAVIRQRIEDIYAEDFDLIERVGDGMHV